VQICTEVHQYVSIEKTTSAVVETIPQLDIVETFPQSYIEVLPGV